jgi:hypothetical protein
VYYMYGNFQNNYFGFPVVFKNNAGDNNSKLSEDAYRVYVNNDYVGSKTLYSTVESIEDVGKYLSNQGFHNFTSDLNGDQYVIHSNGNETHDLKETLNVYLNNR